MLELVGYEFRLNGERVGLFTGTPSQRIALEDLSKCDTFTESQVAGLLAAVEKQANELQKIANDLPDEEYETRFDIEGVVAQLIEIDVE